jgi:hypothetical protein
MLFALSNLPYWILLGIGISLYLLIILAGGGDDDVDVDADIDADADIDQGGLDFDTEADDGADFNPLQWLGWLGLGKAPLMLLLANDLSFWGLFGWMLNVAIATLAVPTAWFVSGAVLIVSFLGAVILGSVTAQPIGKIFAAFGEDVSGDRLIGCVGTVSSGRVPYQQEGTICQVDVMDSSRNLITVNAALPNWATVDPQRGEKVLVIDRDNQIYLVVAKDSPDQEHWFANSTSRSPT